MRPENIMGDLKAYASRALNRKQTRREKHWASHGSTRYLWREQAVEAAIGYVMAGQGSPMQTYTTRQKEKPLPT
jgi:anti-sigma-K factor RskA